MTPTIIDNKDVRLAPVLEDALTKGGVALDACVGYFNLRGWRYLAQAVDGLEGLPDRPPARVLVGMAAGADQVIREEYRVRGADEEHLVTNKEALRIKQETLGSFRTQLIYGLPNDQDEKHIRKFRSQLENGRVKVKLFTRYPLHAKLYLIHLAGGQVIPSKGFLGSSNLTFSGLSKGGELNVDVVDEDANKKLHSWFEERWEDTLAIDISDDLIELLDKSWAAETQPDPYLIYLKLAYELSRDAREGLREFDIPKEFHDQLLPHQADAVSVACRIIQHRGGVMIGDVVGLGKTLIATAVARILYEQENAETLVICPKNLVEMWEEHLDKFEIRHKVIPNSMVDKDLDGLRRYRFLIIDESHNFRNTETAMWKAVRGYIERNDPKVALLTATPYNKEFQDASGQLRLWKAADEDFGIRPERQIELVGEQAVAEKSDGRLTSLKAFESSNEAEDWQRLMSLFLVRRTRRFVEERYGEEDEDGRIYLTFPDGTPFYFPARIPCPLEYEGGDDDPGDRLASPEVVDQINDLQLPRYQLGAFLLENLGSEIDDYEKEIQRLERSRGNLLGFTRTTLLKRLSSCGQSFLVSVERHLLRNYVVLHALEEELNVPIGISSDRRWERLDDLGDLDIDGLDAVVEGGSNRAVAEWQKLACVRYEELEASSPAGTHWIPSSFFRNSLQEALRADNEILQGLLDEHGPWDPAEDSKIEALCGLISDTHPGEKILIFSEYADTAEYVREQLGGRLPEVAIDVATGDTGDPTLLARRFSPKSNESIGGLPNDTEELQVLVATDVLSEGQNLQDAARVVSYDLPWTIIRLIQRAGRVDRVGQESPEVFVYSFLPQEGVDKVIALRRRIRERLMENAEVFGGHERFFDDDIPADEDLEGIFDGTASLDDVETDEDVDWASQAYAIWEAAPEVFKEKARALQDVSYSTRAARDDKDQEGCLVYTRTSMGIEGMAFTIPASDQDDGVTTRTLTPLEALAKAKAESSEPALSRRADHHGLVEEAVTEVLWKAAKKPMSLPTLGPRKRLYNSLTEFLEANKGTYYDTPEFSALIERVYQTPLQEGAKQRVLNALRRGHPEDVHGLAMDLDERNELLIDIESNDDEMQIVCSLGVTNPS